MQPLLPPPRLERSCNKQGRVLVPDLQKIMAESRDYKELLFAWQGWRNASGRALRQDYQRYVELANKAATLNGTTFQNKSPGTHRCGSGRSLVRIDCSGFHEIVRTAGTQRSILAFMLDWVNRTVQTSPLISATVCFQVTLTTEPSGAPCTRRPRSSRTWSACGRNWNPSTSTCTPTCADPSTRSTEPITST